jgi:glutamate-1-semialdehyde 2,1-aminomutase
MMNKNETLFSRAKALIPGGVNSPVRAFQAIGGIPRFVERAQGPYFWDVEGKRYIDYIGSWGPMILGHTAPEVVDTVKEAMAKGFSFGAPTERELELADAILHHMPALEMVRLVSSGTEACMSAIRLARGFTRRDKVIKFEGCYHGHADSLLVKAGSGLATFATATSSGVPEAAIQDTIVLPYNDVNQLQEAFDTYGQDIATVIMEPITGNMNFIRASIPFMEAAYTLCQKHGALLILDEVMTGFRVALGGAQSLYAHAIPDFKPHLTVLGKVIGGGMPLAAFGGAKEIMQHLSPVGSVYQAGTLSGNPVATACGLATLREISTPGFFERLHQSSQKLIHGFQDLAKQYGVNFCGDYQGGMFGFFFLPQLPTNYQDVNKTDTTRFNHFFHYALDRGVYFAPSLYEAGFISSTHTADDIDQTLSIVKEAFSYYGDKGVS